MNRTKFFLFSVAVLLLLTGAASTTKAQNTAIVTENNNCLIPDGNRQIRVMKCTQGGIRYTITNGYIKTFDNYCFDHGVVRYTNPGNDARAVKLVPCREGNKSQVWYIISSGPSAGVIQNAVNPDVCLNIEYGNDSPGSRVLVWPCGFGHPARNETFYIGGAVPLWQPIYVRTDEYNALNNGGSVTFGNGSRIVAQGGGNIVAQGGGNIVAQGGGNIVAQGGGNLIAAGPARIVAQGGGNLVGPSSGTLISPNGSNIFGTIIGSLAGASYRVSN